MPSMESEIEDALSLGRENQEFVRLGKAWCTHIRIDRSGVGIGMLEQESGLPISGGRFTCDYAANPAWAPASHLSVSALDFYEDNCRGCSHRSTGGRILNLGTWAEGRLSVRAEEQAVEAAASEAARREAEQRAAQRRLVAASLSAQCQDVIEFINRVDFDATDTEAAESLLAVARLNPEAFPTEIKQLLLADARTLESHALLGVLVELCASGDFPGLHALCVAAVRGGWGITEGCRHLSRHGTTDDIDNRLLDVVVAHAAPEDGDLFREPGDPAALIRYHSLAPDRIEAKLAEMLRKGEPWVRASAAAGLRAVLKIRSEAGPRLLPPLLDALRHPEDISDPVYAAHEAASSVAVVLHNAPATVADAIGRRWPRASSEYRTRLMSCFDLAIRHHSKDLPVDIAQAILDKAVQALSEPFTHEVGGIDVDFQGRAADTLLQLVRVAPVAILSSDVLIGLLLKWLEHEREFSEVQLTGPLAALEQMSLAAQIRHYIRDISEAIVSAGSRAPSEFLSVCKQLYEGADSSPAVRAEVVQMAGQVAAKSLSVSNDALPLIYGAMLGDDQWVRASGMEAAGEMMRALPSESIPPLLATAASAGLSDQYLIVREAAVRAVRYIPTDLVSWDPTVVEILGIALTYAHDRTRDHLVRDAIHAARHLANEEQEKLNAVRSATLKIAERMPAHEARRLLCRQRWLEDHPEWTQAAIHALRPDDDLQYEHLGDRDREDLLKRLGHKQLSDSQVDALAVVLVQTSRRDHKRWLQAADVFAELGHPNLSADTIATYQDEVPDTIEMSELRRHLGLTQLAFETEAAIAATDSDTRRSIRDQLEQWSDAQ